MHELSLIEFTLDAVERKAKQMDIAKVGEICIVVGRLSAVPMLLTKAFDIMKYNRPIFHDTKLLVELREVKFKCPKCGEEFIPEVYSDAVCLTCGNRNLQRISGDELYIDYFTAIDNPECT